MRLVKLLFVTALVWALYWVAGLWGLRQGIDGWFAEQERQGWLAEHAGLPVSGFPLVHGLRIINPVLADPGTGTAWSADWIALERPALPFGLLTMRFPATIQRISHFDQTLSLRAEGMSAELDLAPGTALAPERLELRSGPFSLLRGEGEAFQASSFSFNMLRTGKAPEYRLSAQLKGLHFSEFMGHLPAQPETDNQSLPEIEILAGVQFDAAWDRRAIEMRRPQPRQIEITQARLSWDRIELTASGTVEIDETGRATGHLDLKASQWSDLLRIAETSGVLPPRLRPATQRIFRLLARMSGNEAELNVTLFFWGDQMFLGPLPLGAAPRIILY